MMKRNKLFNNTGTEYSLGTDNWEGHVRGTEGGAQVGLWPFSKCGRERRELMELLPHWTLD